jgi:hypothetical protein
MGLSTSQSQVGQLHPSWLSESKPAEPIGRVGLVQFFSSGADAHETLELNGGAMGSIDEPEGGYRVLIPGTPEFGHLDVPRRASLAFLPFDPVQGSTGCTALDE